MATKILKCFSLKTIEKFSVLKTGYRLPKTNFCTLETVSIDSNKKTEEEPNENKNEPVKHTFASLLRNSSFISLGDPVGKKVIGTIFNVTGNDLYIDFGWKFHCVCEMPKRNQELYTRGAKVMLLIKDLELSTKFLGSTRDTTLCEADCVLLGLYNKEKSSFKAAKNISPSQN